MNLSEPQQRVVRHHEQRGGNCAVISRAGSGKSSTKAACAHALPSMMHGNVLATAKNNHIINNDRAKMPPGMIQKTLHGAGLGAMSSYFRPYGNRYVVEHKYRYILQEAFALPKDTPPTDEQRDLLNESLSVLNLCRQEQIDPCNLLAVENAVDTFGIEHENDLWSILDLVAPSIDRGRKEAYRWVDFQDMINLPVELNIPIKPYEMVMVDEFQDMNPPERRLVRKLAGDRPLTIFGDPQQTIYGWVGAMTGDMEQTAEENESMIYHLSVCYRCPTRHLTELAQQIVPDIEPAPDAIPGHIYYVSESNIVRQLEKYDPKDVVMLCRTTQPLVEMYHVLIRRGIRACLRGRNMGKKLLEIVSSLSKKDHSYEDFHLHLAEYESRKLHNLLKRDGNEMAIEALMDRCDSLRSLHDLADSEGTRTWSDLERYIDHLFNDEENSRVTLSTVHKAKGGEWKHVFILRHDLMPHKKAKLGWQLEQEENLRYIAYTRAKETITFVEPERKD